MIYHIPKDHHKLPIQFGEQIETLCEVRIIVKSQAHSVTLRDTSMGGNAEACPACSDNLKSSAIRMAFMGEEIIQEPKLQQNQATA